MQTFPFIFILIAISSLSAVVHAEGKDIEDMIDVYRNRIIAVQESLEESANGKVHEKINVIEETPDGTVEDAKIDAKVVNEGSKEVVTGVVKEKVDGETVKNLKVDATATKQIGKEVVVVDVKGTVDENGQEEPVQFTESVVLNPTDPSIQGNDVPAKEFLVVEEPVGGVGMGMGPIIWTFVILMIVAVSGIIYFYTTSRRSRRSNYEEVPLTIKKVYN